ncbi:MAG: TSUP family transporter [Phycisphaerales bacterium]|nr:TSUP family transporter [Phycisphaerales bacterium]
MEVIVVAISSLLAAGLTLFSGFGLNTVLLPVFLVLFPEPVAVGAVAIVHLANGLFKLAIVGKWADRKVVLRFGVPALLAAIAGAAALTYLAAYNRPIATYELLGRDAAITPIKVVFAGLIAGFAVLELVPRLAKLRVRDKWLPVGGVLSGFFGGLSGHQGALRSIFLVRSGMTMEAYIGTATVCSVMVDVVRLIVYFTGAAFFAHRALAEAMGDRRTLTLVTVGALAAFCGSYVASRYVKSMTMERVRLLVGVMLLLSAAAIGSGLL